MPKKFQATVNEYDGGTNAVIHYDGKNVSATKTDSGLYDVQSDKGDFIYTGTDEGDAARATRDYLKGE